VADRSHVRARRGDPGQAIGPSPVDRAGQAPSPPADRRPRDPARGHRHRRQPQRHHPTAAAAGRRPAGAGQARSAAPPAHGRLRRQGL
jgi:hypothetical protein